VEKADGAFLSYASFIRETYQACCSAAEEGHDAVLTRVQEDVFNRWISNNPHFVGVDKFISYCGRIGRNQSHCQAVLEFQARSYDRNSEQLCLESQCRSSASRIYAKTIAQAAQPQAIQDNEHFHLLPVHAVPVVVVESVLISTCLKKKRAATPSLKLSTKFQQVLIIRPLARTIAQSLAHGKDSARINPESSRRPSVELPKLIPVLSQPLQSLAKYTLGGTAA
jgi:hypothetical protein